MRCDIVLAIFSQKSYSTWRETVTERPLASRYTSADLELH